MHRAPRVSGSAWIQLVAALMIAVVAVLSPRFAFGDLEEHTTISDGGTGTVSSEGDPLQAGVATAGVSPAGTGYSIMKVSLNSGKTINARWNPCQSAVTWRANLSGLPKAKRAAMLKTITASFKRLSAATGITYRYQGTTTFVPKTGNLEKAPAEIVVAAVSKSRTDFPMNDNSLGYGGVLWSSWYGGTQGEGAAVMRGYVVLEAKAIQKLKTGFGSGLRQSNVILHELGHASGLEHVKDRKQQMYPTLTTASPSGFARGDLTGLKKVGRSAGCIAVPGYAGLKDLN
ncbi:matrixin family metalloprotease [Kineosporia sp. J2-2]|uniref:Matrixin family metalloprotease n=1 Tax=Kineosporia corallincola TaxID=2835133 RepID=A0ABS5TJT9_9ACTN|nr:matrixin family metalloprotease [Kineosporia corallincola]MBT0771379.1 matrixin family metalloprotease [Kineosporia corallincola]